MKLMQCLDKEGRFLE